MEVFMKPNMELRKFVAPEIIIGEDASLLIGRYLHHFSSHKPMIVTDKGIREQDWFDAIMEILAHEVEDYVIFDDVTPNPKDYEAMKGAHLFLEEGCDLIVAVGGGSPMDCAKCISVVSSNGGHILDYEGVDQVDLPGPPLICIPSTAGTSADVSQFTIINDSTMNIKKTIISKKVVPDLALIDPIPLMTMPSYLAACTGIDALTHAIEAFVSNAHSPLTDVHALEAIRLIGENLEACVLSIEEGKPDKELCYLMMTASLDAGLAFSNASLGAVHAMAHSLGGFFDLPHGECNSILLKYIVEANYESAKDRYDCIAKALGVEEKSERKATGDDLIERLHNMGIQLNIAQTLAVDVLSNDIMDKLVTNAMEDPCMVTNPKQLSSMELRKVYERILAPTEGNNIQ